ncbi:hypothetical protein CIB93_09090 [Streptomyces sp. WZ.A104]|uniref:hypothetical protein n=1 Tax=Streptomyces sp. WZ.A104 TaxID=2023771 RepID=UPI000BBBCDE4|nr:hypothetical protein [Streptomyces sp. WZ.A104]PCG86376.1 hypothetical protein CIB93_09090 [Streptomyces sp. WZ.A104]
MKQLVNALVESSLAGAFAAACWVLIDVDPNLWQFTASSVAAFVALESVRSLRRHVERRAVQS